MSLQYSCAYDANAISFFVNGCPLYDNINPFVSSAAWVPASVGFVYTCTLGLFSITSLHRATATVLAAIACIFDVSIPYWFSADTTPATYSSNLCTLTSPVSISFNDIVEHSIPNEAKYESGPLPFPLANSIISSAIFSIAKSLSALFWYISEKCFGIYFSIKYFLYFV